MSYIQLYIYRVKKENRTKFLEIARKTNKIFHKYGVEGEELFLLQSKTPKYGVTGLWNVIPLNDDEELWIGLNRFKNVKHCEEVMEKFDKDPETEDLYQQFVTSVTEVSRVIRGEFEKIA